MNSRVTAARNLQTIYARRRSAPYQLYLHAAIFQPPHSVGKRACSTSPSLLGCLDSLGCSTRFHSPATGCEGLGEEFMSFDFLLGGATFIGLLAYLLFALVRCERF
jgi:hypothetical protein